MQRILAVVLAVLALSSTSALAQVLPEGTRVRAMIPTVSPGHLYGRLVVLSGDTITLRDVHGYVPGGTYFARNVSVPRHAVPTVEYLHSRDRRTGAFYGAAIGLIPAVVAYLDVKRSDYPHYAGLTFLLYGVVAVPTFALIGSYFGPERWEPVRPWP
jgi:hypothetical protein